MRINELIGTKNPDKIEEAILNNGPVAIEAGHHPVYLKDGKVEHGAIDPDAEDEIVPIRGISNSEIFSFTDGFLLSLFCQAYEIRYKLFTSVSNIRGHTADERRQISEMLNKNPIAHIPEEFKEMAYQAGELLMYTRGAIEELLKSVVILSQSDFGTHARNKIYNGQKKVDKKIDPKKAAAWHKQRYYNTGNILLESIDDDGARYSFLSTPRTREDFSMPIKEVDDYVKKVGAIPIRINGATRCGPIAAGMHMEMMRRLGSTKGTFINVYSNDDSKIDLKCTRGSELIKALDINRDGDNLFLVPPKKNRENGYDVIGKDDYTPWDETKEKPSFEEALMISVSRLKNHADFPVIWLRNAQNEDQKRKIQQLKENTTEKETTCNGVTCDA